MKEPVEEIVQLVSMHVAPVNSFLKSTGLPLGRCINCNVTRLKYGIWRTQLILIIYALLGILGGSK